MTALDILVILLVGGGIVTGYFRGFVGEILSLLAWVGAVFALKFFHTPVAAALVGPVGTAPGASVLAFALIFGFTYLVIRLMARRLGDATRSSAVGPVDRVLGSGFGALKGLLLATLFFLAATLVYDTIWGRAAARPDWIADSRTYPLLHASSTAIVDYVEERRRRSPAPEDAE
jgi:membrane protein required for colicin V production